MKKITTFFAILFFVNAFSQTIDIGPDEYAFRYSVNTNFGLFFNAVGEYQFKNGTGANVFAFNANNGRMATNLEFDSGTDYLVPNDRYAFRAKSDSDFGLFFNAANLSYDFRNNLGNSVFSIGANSGNLVSSGYLLPGNSGQTVAGAIRYNGSDLEGYIDNVWTSLTATGGSGGGSLQDAFDNGNTINTTTEPLLIEGFEGLIISQGQNASTEGIGVKMFFDPTNVSFRCGSVNATAWNEANRGAGSAAFGLSTIASGLGSFATGNATEASGERSAAFGTSTISSGSNSFAAGLSTIAIGDYASAFGESGTASGLASFVAGEDNVASGQSSVSFGRNSEATGSFSFASGNGSSALGSSSVAIGSFVDATGDVSAAFGFGTDAEGFGSTAAGWGSSASGDGSVALGRGTLAKSAHETAIGSFNTDYTPNSTTENDDNDRLFVIGNGSSIARSNAMVVLKNGNTGIGTSTPDTKLTISGVANKTVGLNLEGGSNYLGFDGWEIGKALNESSPVINGDLVIRNSGTPRFNMWNGYFAPSTDNIAALGLFSQRWNTIYAGNGTINTSDAREKKNIQKLDYGLETLMKLNPVSYEWKEDHMNIGTKIGFIAQELLEIIPEVVVTEERVENRETGEISFEEAERMGVFYDDLIPVLTKAIQEQQGQIAEVVEENEELQKENEDLRNDVKDLLESMQRFEQDLQTCCFSSQTGINENGTNSDEQAAELGQNIPNPFSESTLIRYYLPDGTANAIIRITDMEGSPVEDLQLGAQRGANQVEFQTQGLASGTYLYSLFVDGKFVDTKKMMIAK